MKTSMPGRRNCDSDWWNLNACERKVFILPLLDLPTICTFTIFLLIYLDSCRYSNLHPAGLVP
jgi:hypothetical protein